MKKHIIFHLVICLFCGFSTTAQSYAPPAGQTGTTAIHKDSSVFVSWANGVSFTRGFLQITDTTIVLNGDNKASHGEALDAIGTVEGNSMNVLSLGDGGSATLTFSSPIFDGEGPDFAVFENSFQDDFLELAFVEVSSDGEHFFRFPAYSENQFVEQIFSFGLMDCRMVHNLAGKYRQAFGTPFDLTELPNNPLLDKMNITHVRIVDVVGIIEPEFASYDVLGNIINDPFPTPFESGGFDLDGVGVIHQKPLSLSEESQVYSIFPNPVKTNITIHLKQYADLFIHDVTGKAITILNSFKEGQIDLGSYNSGIYFLTIQCDNQKEVVRFVKE